MKSESETKWMTLMSETNEKFANNEKIAEDDYEFESDDATDVALVKCLDWVVFSDWFACYDK